MIVLSTVKYYQLAVILLNIVLPDDYPPTGATDPLPFPVGWDKYIIYLFIIYISQYRVRYTIIIKIMIIIVFL